MARKYKWPGNHEVGSFYDSGEAAVVNALTRVDAIVSRGVSPGANMGLLSWNGGGLADVISRVSPIKFVRFSLRWTGRWR